MNCPVCGQENPAGFKFCGACGAELDAAPATAREERKVITVLFADLVGFTSRAEKLDPEDVRAMLSPYYARLRHELERSEEHTSELQSRPHLVCRLLLEKKKLNV